MDSNLQYAGALNLVVGPFGWVVRHRNEGAADQTSNGRRSVTSDRSVVALKRSLARETPVKGGRANRERRAKAVLAPNLQLR
jgi:hypothetical protein